MARVRSNAVPKIKGVGMLTAVRALRSMGKGKARELLAPELHKYLDEERILAVAWYPEADMLELNRALAQIMRPTLPRARIEDTYVHMGRLVGSIDLSGMYASLQHGRLDNELVQRIAAGWRQYHDTGSMTATFENDRVRFELRDYGLPNQELCWIQRGWYLTYLERTTGSKHVTVSEPKCCLRGDPSCIWEGTWR
jgi:predicted hydrocarbon binding protein